MQLVERTLESLSQHQHLKSFKSGDIAYRGHFWSAGAGGALARVTLPGGTLAEAKV